MSIILVAGDHSYYDLFHDYGTVVSYSSDWRRVSMLVLTGGQDVNPELYGEKAHSKTVYNPSRDDKDFSLFQAAISRQIPIVGICRGAQFLTVMNGGKLYQHVNNHTLPHNIRTYKGTTIPGVTSTHHQMMQPWRTNHKLLAWAEGLSEIYESGEGSKPALKYSADSEYVVEPEVVWYPDTMGLAVQYHPEMMIKDAAGRKFFHEMIKEFLL